MPLRERSLASQNLINSMSISHYMNQGGRSCGSAESALPERSRSLRKEGFPLVTPQHRLFCFDLRSFKAFGELGMTLWPTFIGLIKTILAFKLFPFTQRCNSFKLPFPQSSLPDNQSLSLGRSVKRSFIYLLALSFWRVAKS